MTIRRTRSPVGVKRVRRLNYGKRHAGHRLMLGTGKLIPFRDRVDDSLDRTFAKPRMTKNGWIIAAKDSIDKSLDREFKDLG